MACRTRCSRSPLPVRVPLQRTPRPLQPGHAPAIRYRGSAPRQQAPGNHLRLLPQGIRHSTVAAPGAPHGELSLAHPAPSPPFPFRPARLREFAISLLDPSLFGCHLSGVTGGNQWISLPTSAKSRASQRRFAFRPAGAGPSVSTRAASPISCPSRAIPGSRPRRSTPRGSGVSSRSTPSAASASPSPASRSPTSSRARSSMASCPRSSPARGHHARRRGRRLLHRVEFVSIRRLPR